MNKQNSNSHLTAIDRTTLSFPARILLNQEKIKGNILDFGCGMGKDVEILKQKGYDILGYDPYYFPTFPVEKFDTILCFYVLNVLLPEEQVNVLLNIYTLLKPEGKAYFAVRRDIKYEGYRMHKLHKKETYQCLIKLPFMSIFKNENCEIYEFEHTAFYNKHNKDVGFLKKIEVDELVKSKKLQFDKSNLVIQIYKKLTGIEYIRIIQNIDLVNKNTILINPNNINQIIDTLIDFREEISLNQKIKDNYTLLEKDKQPIINTFLKGITIKNISLQFGYNEDTIRDLLLKNEIEIIEGIEINPNKNPKKIFWRKKR